MKTRLTITIDGTEHELGSDCLYNWDEVLCTYKRTDFSGVVRAFSSKFEFVNDAYELLLATYLKNGMRASAIVTLYTLNNDWTWKKEFESALNFSTATWDGYIFSVNCIDDGLAALIKSRKSTKYEFEVGKDIEVGGILNYDRMTMQNSCAHEIMGDSDSSGAVIITNAKNSTRLPVYSLTSETFENSPILFGNQDVNSGDSFITTERSASNLKIRLEIWANRPNAGVSRCYAKSVNIHLMQFTGADNGMSDKGTVFSYASQIHSLSSHSSTTGICDRTCVGTFSSLEDLQRAYPNPPQDVWAKIGKSDSLSDVESVYFTPVSNKDDLVQWERGVMAKDTSYRNGPVVRVSCETKKYIMEYDFPTLNSGQKFALFYTADIVNIASSNSRTPEFALFSKITTSWDSKAKNINISAIKPITLVSSLMERITDGKYNVIPQFSERDTRLAKTYLLPAECVRNIPGAKIYTSFNDFCDWMETVFGYVYELGDVSHAQYNGMLVFKSILDDWIFDVDYIHGRVVEGYCPDGYDSGEVFFIRSHNCFCVWDNHETGNMFTQWKNSHKYNNENGSGRNDLIFDDGSKYYVMNEGDLVEFTGDAKVAARPTQSINFMHRSELFKNQEQGIDFTDAKEPQTKINANILYSIVEVGYEKQDYETECGRDEWNFMNYYNTGVDVTEKKLTLQSKYRADCYGLEFLSQERAKDSTDNKSDSTIFFVYCTVKTNEEEQDNGEAGSRGDEGDVSIQVTTSLEIDHSAKISGAMSDSVFNGEFSPYYCVKANEGYISAMAPDVTLQFASSDGNSDIVIDGVKTTANIPLSSRLFAESELEFTATDLDQSIDFSKLIKVVKNGLVYSGFLKETEFCYARPSEVKYTLIVKDIQPI